MSDYKLPEKQKTIIINKLRSLSYQWKPRTDAMKKHKVAPATLACDTCGKWCYEGKSEKNFDQMVIDNPDKIIVYKKAKRDHLIPVVDPTKGFTTWDDYILRMFCAEENFSPKCDECHKIKSAKEKSLTRK